MFLNARTVSLDLTIPQRTCGGSVAGGANDSKADDSDIFVLSGIVLRPLLALTSLTTRLPC